MIDQQMDEHFRALADFMEWVDPEGYAGVLSINADVVTPPGKPVSLTTEGS